MEDSEGNRSADQPVVEKYSFGSFRLDVSAHRLSRDGQPVPLAPKIFETLLILVRHGDRVVSKDELISTLWPNSFVTEDSLTQNISTLRRALGHEPGIPEFVATIHRSGYRFVAPITPFAPRPRPADAAEPNLVADRAAESPARRLSIASTDRRLWWLIGLGAAAVLIVGFFAARRVLFPPPLQTAVSLLRFTQSPPDGTTLVAGASLSPNGRDLVFAALDERSGQAHLWVRVLDTPESRELVGTEGASDPFWSPDSESIGYFADGKLRTVGLNGALPRTLTTAGLGPSGGTWSAQGRILFAPWKGGLSMVTTLDGHVTPVTTLDAAARDIAHRRPQFLPDGRHFIYQVLSLNPERQGTYVGDIDSAIRVRVLDTLATYAPPDELLWPREHELVAQRFDLDRLRIADTPITVSENINPGVVLSGSEGLLAFGGAPQARHLAWFNRSGKLGNLIQAPAILHNPVWSVDEHQLLASGEESKGMWQVDLDRGAATRIALDGVAPMPSPDGSRIAFTSDRLAGTADLYLRPTLGRADDELLLRTNENKIINDWSKDGEYIVYVSTNPQTEKDIWLLPLKGDRRPVSYLQTPSNEIQAQISPDGRWLAYASDESGTWEVYVQSFPTPGGKRTVSVGGGAQPRWRADGRELFYLAADRTIMAVAVTPGETVTIGPPTPLFKAPVFGKLYAYRSHYLPTADGQHFIADIVDPNTDVERITVLVNWQSLLASD